MDLPNDWQSKVRVKHEDIYIRIPAAWKLDEELTKNPTSPSNAIGIVPGLLSQHEQQITALSVGELLERLHRGDLTSQEVLGAFCHRSSIAHQLTRCLSEVNFEHAQRQAQQLDEWWRTRRAPIGPLHGLPVSLMDRFHVAGLDSACGFASWVGTKRTSEDEGALVQSLRQLGAVVFCKTAVPMTMMLGETASNIIGTTVNPYDRSLSAGGACGGEGALIALRGSPLGIGTDVAGSSRIPSAFNGLWAMKCSERRLSQTGLATVLQGIPVSSGTIGIISNELGSLSIILKALIGSKPWLSDPEVLEIPWRDDKVDLIRRRSCQPGTRNGRLTLGIMMTDGQVEPVPAIKRAISFTSNALLTSGYEIIDWQPPPHAEAVENLFKILGSTSATDARAAINASGEPAVAQLRGWFDQGGVEPNTSAEFWGLCNWQNRYRANYSQYWRSTGTKSASGRQPDAVILPVASTTAPRHTTFRYFGYSAIANVLDYPAGTIPIEIPEFLADGDPKDEMPVGIQVMSLRLQEEQLLEIMEAISEAVEATRQRLA